MGDAEASAPGHRPGGQGRPSLARGTVPWGHQLGQAVHRGGAGRDPGSSFHMSAVHRRPREARRSHPARSRQTVRSGGPCGCGGRPLRSGTARRSCP